ncbi:MAG TPA: formimidoylglutamase [Gemmatimonadales bacterium]|nr:formimidoylglutamase [Gemmatimonadales bacterium]
MSAHDPRLGDLLGRGLRAGGDPRAVLLGFPSDEGVRRNGGRPGAREGPAAIRRALRRLTPDPRDAERSAALLERTADLGDLPVTGDLEADQAGLADALAPWLGAGTFAIVLGGGHETAYGHFLGYVKAGRSVDLLNWDAHPDVRPALEGLGHSGSPFRQALEHPGGRARSYTAAGLQPHATARAHLDYVLGIGRASDKGGTRGAAPARGRAVFREEVTPTLARELYAVLQSPALVSFDLDAVDQTAAPGVSAPTAGGLDPALWLRLAALAGETPAVASAEVVEFNPAHDADGATARLAALTVWHLLAGLARRIGA